MVYWQKDVKRRANTYDVTETSFTDVGAFPHGARGGGARAASS